MYDYIILGGGAAGLSLAARMSRHHFFADKKIVIIEPDAKVNNDRTWCFWSKHPSYYEDIIHKSFSQLSFYDDSGHRDLKMGQYRYHMIRGIDFYNYNYKLLADTHIEVIRASVNHVNEYADRVNVILTDGRTVGGKTVFKSYVDQEIDYKNHPYVDQHFKGWVVETDTDTFDVDRATFMDFRIEQGGETRFLYVLPLSKRKALVEVAIFSNQLLSHPEYNAILADYISHYINIGHYKIVEEEYGVIPMTSYPFHRHNTDRIYGIGTMGGIVKGSSGYAFQRIQQHSDAIIDALVHGKDVSKSYTLAQNRFAFYDKIFLYAVLNKTSGKEVFSRLFAKREAHEIFDFLNQESSFIDDLKIFTAPPFMPFLSSLFRVM